MWCVTTLFPVFSHEVAWVNAHLSCPKYTSATTTICRFHIRQQSLSNWRWSTLSKWFICISQPYSDNLVKCPLGIHAIKKMLVLLKCNDVKMFFFHSLINMSGQNDRKLKACPDKWSSWPDIVHWQHAKKVVSDSPRLVDFVIGLVNSAFNLPDEQVKYFEEFNLQRNGEITSAHQKIWGASWNDVRASKC